MRHQEVIIELIRKNGYRRIAEVGVCKGYTAFTVLSRCEVEVYYAIDSRFNPEFYQHLTQHYYPELKVYSITSREAAGQIPSNLDLVFIDADHSEAAVVYDICLWLPKVRPGGILCGHDYGSPKWQGVKAAVDRVLDRDKVELVDTKGVKLWIYKKPSP